MRQRFEAEYRRMLAYQTVDELQTIAKRRGIALQETTKEAIVEVLASPLCESQAIRAQISSLDKPGRYALTYMHLAMGPEYGLSVENLLRELAQRYQDRDHVELEQVLPRADESASLWLSPGTHRRAIFKQLIDLSERGLLLPFRHNSALYYSLPEAVRAALSPQPDMIPAYPEDKVASLHVHETSLGSWVQTLFTVWDTVSVSQVPALQSHQREHEPTLEGWRDPSSERSEAPRQRLPHNRPSTFRPSFASTNPQVQAVTVPPATHRLSHALHRTLQDRTGCTDQELEFYYSLLERLGAIDGDAESSLTLREGAIRRFLSLPPAEKIRGAWQIWKINTAWSEMDIVLHEVGVSPEYGKDGGPGDTEGSMPYLRLRRNLVHPDYKAQDLYREWAAGRQAVLRFLSLSPGDCWISLEGLLRAIFEVHPNLLHTRSDSTAWWIESVKTRRQFGTTFDDWRQSYGRFVVAVIEGPLKWLGMASLGYDDDELKAFKLTSAGLFALGRRSKPAESIPLATERQQPVCTIADDLTVTLIPGQAPLELYDLLYTIAEMKEATPQRFVYRITAERLFRTAGSMPHPYAGHEDTRQASIERLIDTLDRYSGSTTDDHRGNQNPGPSPRREVMGAWQDKLRTWSRNYGKLHVYENVTLIELADDYALRELMIATSLREHLVYQFSPRLIAVRSEAVDTLIQEMEKRGYTPRVK